MTAPNSDYLQEIADRARTMHAQRPSVDDTLSTITRAAVDTVPGASHAGITFVTGKRRLESRAPTSPVPQKLDALQEELGEGPCLDAVFEQDTINVPDLAADPRWPRFSAAAVELGVGSMLSFQLYTDNDNLGALNLYGMTTQAFGHDSHDLGLTLATHAAIALSTARQQSQWASALASRDLIGQAKGMLMERYDIDSVAAFELIRQLSQERNTKVIDLARSIVRRNRTADSE